MKSLESRTIVVTLARHQPGAFADLLSARVETELPIPTIAIAPPPLEWTAIDTALGALDRYDWSVVTSANALADVARPLEVLTAIRRAGADTILTYHALDAARWLSE